MKINILSNFSADFLSRFIDNRLVGDVVDSRYDQYAQLICISSSNLYKTPYDAALLLLDYSKLLFSMSVGDVKELLIELTECYSQYSNDSILIINNAYLKRGVTSTKDTIIYDNNKNIQVDINLFLNQLSKQSKGMHIFDMLSIYEEYGYFNLTDHNISLISDNPFSKMGLEIISSELVDYVNALIGSRKKCLVLDFDNTLWCGIAGEDELGVNIGDDRIGSVYLQFQREIKKLKDKGVLLAACSKNNLEDAKKIFDDHPNMILKWDDFIAHKVNWIRKDFNVLEISNELNIGDDSLIFIDDSPIERLLVSEGTNAKAPEFPKDLDLVKMISEVDRKYFSTNTVTKEDLAKHQQYLENIERENASKNYSDIDNFINSLEMKIFVRLNNKIDLDRAFQLAQKTNQFNFTTKRYSKKKIKDMMSDNAVDVLTCRVEDRFGNYGTTVLLIVMRQGLTWKIDNFIMSCRVLGRQVENAVLNWYLANRYNGECLKAYYKPTNKNKQLENKYEDLGFVNLEKKGSYYVYQLENKQEFKLSVEVCCE